MEGLRVAEESFFPGGRGDVWGVGVVRHFLEICQAHGQEEAGGKVREPVGPGLYPGRTRRRAVSVPEPDDNSRVMKLGGVEEPKVWRSTKPR